MTSGRRPIKHWPSAERPRERLIEKGADSLSDAQLLAILLRTGDTSRSALDLALALLVQFGGLAGLAAASVAELCEIKGLGPAKAAQLKAGIELARRLGNHDGAGRPAFHGGEDVFRHLSAPMSGLPHEEFRLLLLDTKHRLNREMTISRGTLAGTAVDPREVFSAALRERAAAVVCVHNHPSGDPGPSPEDRALTSRLRQSGQLVGVPLLDHVIVGRGAFFSFAEAGWPP